jgi:hypothetical protein
LNFLFAKRDGFAADKIRIQNENANFRVFCSRPKINRASLRELKALEIYVFDFYSMTFKTLDDQHKYLGLHVVDEKRNNRILARIN